MIFEGPVVDLDFSIGCWINETKKVMNLKKQLRLYLEEYDISAAQLSKKSGVSKQVISLWLSGGSPRKLEQVKKVADVFKTSIDHLCYGEGIETSKINMAPMFEQDGWMSGIFEIRIRKVK